MTGRSCGGSGAPAARTGPAWARVGVTAAVAGTVAATGDVRTAAVVAAAGVAFWILFAFLDAPATWAPAFLGAAILLPPLPLSLGSGFVHPALGLSACAVFIAWVRLREWDVAVLEAAWFVLPAALLFSVPWAFLYSGSTAGWESAARWLLLAQPFLVFAWLAAGPHAQEANIAAAVKTVLAGALAAAAFAVLDFVFQPPGTIPFAAQYLYLPEGVFRRAQGTFYDANALGNFCAIAALLVIALGRETAARLGIRAWLRWAPVPFLLTALVLTFSRSSMLNAIAGVLVIAWLRRRSLPLKRVAAATVILALASGGALLVLAPGITARYSQHLQFSVVELLAKPDDVLSHRLDTWNRLSHFAAGHPSRLLFGIGYKTLPHTDYLGNAVVADNMYLSLLVETGIPGSLALLLLSGFLLRRAWRFSQHEDCILSALGIFLLAAWSGEMLQMLSVDVLTYWRITPVIFAMLGFAVARERELSDSAAR